MTTKNEQPRIAKIMGLIYPRIRQLIAELHASEFEWMLDEAPEFISNCIVTSASATIARRANPKAEKEEIKRQALQLDSATVTFSVTMVEDPATLEAVIDRANYQLALLRQRQEGERRGRFKVVREDG